MLWHRTSPRLLVPLGDQFAVSGGNPPLTVSGMTLVAVDASGRLAELLAVPEPFDSGVAPNDDRVEGAVRGGGPSDVRVQAGGPDVQSAGVRRRPCGMGRQIERRL